MPRRGDWCVRRAGTFRPLTFRTHTRVAALSGVSVGVVFFYADARQIPLNYGEKCGII